MTSSFPNPVLHTCGEIKALNRFAGQRHFSKDDFKYYVDAKDVTLKTIDEDTAPLTLDELSGSDDDVYTWLLVDFGTEESKQIFVKRAINITELGTKHANILIDICEGKHMVDSDLHSHSDNTVIRVYFGGELIKLTSTDSTGTVSTVNYTINFLSGSYSSEGEQVVLSEITDSFIDELKPIFGSPLAPATISISTGKNTFIQASDSIDKFEADLKKLSSHGVKTYKFDMKDKYQQILHNRTIVHKITQYNGRVNWLKTTLPKNPGIKNLQEELKSLLANPVVLAETVELEPYELKGGKKRKPKSKSVKKLKGKKLKKTKKRGKKSKRKIIH